MADIPLKLWFALFVLFFLAPFACSQGSAVCTSDQQCKFCERCYYGRCIADFSLDGCQEDDSSSSGDADTDSDSDTDNDADSDSDSDTDANADTDVDGDADTDTDTDSDVDGDADTDTDTDSDVDSDADTDTDTDSDVDSDTDTDTDTDSDVDSDTDTDTDIDSDVDSDTDADMDTDSDVDSDADTDTDTENSDSDSETSSDVDIDYCEDHSCWTVPPTYANCCVTNIAYNTACGSVGGRPPACDEDFGIEYCGQDAQYEDTKRTFSKVFVGPSREVKIVDSLTGLEWQQTFASNINWTDARSYCETLSYAGHETGWRMPNLQELLSTMNYGWTAPAKWTYPAIDEDLFPAEAETYHDYWTTESDKADHYVAVQSGWGAVRSLDRASNLHVNVRCVWGEEIDFSDDQRYQIQGTMEEMVLDQATGLTWQYSYLTSADWQEALDYCEHRTYAGFDDWRLPNLNELYSLQRVKTEDPKSDFPDMPPERFWSSTPGDHNIGEYVSFGSLDLVSHTFDQKMHARCVRGETYSSPEQLVVPLLHYQFDENVINSGSLPGYQGELLGDATYTEGIWGFATIGRFFVDDWGVAVNTLSEAEIRIWFKEDTLTDNASLIDFRRFSPLDTGVAVYHGFEADSYLVACWASAPYAQCSGAAIDYTIPQGTWHQLVIRWDGLNFDVYLDGELKWHQVPPGNPFAVLDDQLYSMNWTPSFHLEDLRIYDRIVDLQQGTRFSHTNHL